MNLEINMNDIMILSNIECADGHVYDSDHYAVCLYCNKMRTEIKFIRGLQDNVYNQILLKDQIISLGRLQRADRH